MISNAANLPANGGKAVTDDKMQLKILEHCARCERIDGLQKDIRDMRQEMRDGFRGVHERIDAILK